MLNLRLLDALKLEIELLNSRSKISRDKLILIFHKVVKEVEMDLSNHQV